MSSKDLHLFAIGNALVDVQLQVGHVEFNDLGLTKGAMALVDPQRQKELLDRFAHVPANKCSGGSAANTVIAFSQFGGKAAYGSRLGKDEHGEIFAGEFEKLGIELMAHHSEDEYTGTCLVLITPDAERTLNTSLAANLAYNKDHVAEDAIRRSEWLYIEGYKFTEESGAAAIEQAMHYSKKHGTKIAVTFSDTFIVDVFGENLRQAVSAADMIFCNESEAQAYTGKDSPQEAFDALRGSTPNVAMTLGDKGSKVQVGGEVHDIAAVEASAVDTTGAGDIYAAGLLYGITHEHSVEQAGRLAAQVSAKVVSQLGARLQNQDIEYAHKTVLGRS